MAGFIQIIEYSTTRYDEAKALGEKFRAERMADDGGPKPLRVTVTASMDLPNRFMTIAEFSTYEEAMANSARPETGQFAAEMSKLCDGPPTFYNLEVRDTFVP